MEKTDFRTSYMEIILEGMENFRSNPKAFLQSWNFEESNLSLVFEKGWEYPHGLTHGVELWGL